jgi:preprotein translocase SecE subunit
MNKAINFFKDVIEELKKLNIPSKKETYITTITIIVTITIVSLAILLADFIISKVIGLIFGL